MKGARKAKWLKSDVEYANGGYLREQSVSILGSGAGLDWTGTRTPTGPSTNIKALKNYKPPNVKNLKPSDDKPKKSGFFGLF